MTPIRVTRELAELTGLALLGEQRLRSVIAESLPACQPMSSWAEGWIVEPASNARLGLLSRRFRPVPLADNGVEVRARGADVELLFNSPPERFDGDAHEGEEAVLFVRPERGCGIDTLDAFTAARCGCLAC